MRAKRRLTDTLLASLSLIHSPSHYPALSLWVQLCHRALLYIDLQLLTHSEFFKVQFSKTILLTVLRAWISAFVSKKKKKKS